MGNTKFVLKKGEEADIVSCQGNDKDCGYILTPKEKREYCDLVNVKKIAIIDPTLIKKLIDKKCDRTFEKILKIIALLDEDEDGNDSDGNAVLALKELDHFEDLVIKKYKDYIDPRKLKAILKKISVLSSEVQLRLNNLKYESEKVTKKSR